MKRFILPIKMFAAFRAGAALGLFALCLLCSVFWNSEASAERIKDLASIQGVLADGSTSLSFLIGNWNIK